MQYKLIIFCLVLSVTAEVHAQDNWMLTPSFPGGAKTALAAMQDSVFFVGTAHGIHRSGTTGKSWQRVLNTSAIYSLHASASGKIIAGSEGKIYISFDKGLTWDSVKLQTRFPIKEIAESPNGDFYFITGILDAFTGYVGDGVFYNAGDLKTWINKTPGLYHTGYCERIQTDRFNRVYVTMGDENVTGQAGLFISDNKGDTWSRVRLFVTDLGDVKTANTFSVNITPADSVILSVAGTVVNFSVSLNLIKHRNDLLNNAFWKLITVRNTSSWWMDLPLNPIHFAADGSWYASVTSSPSQGGVFVSNPGGRLWSKYNTGLAAATSTQFESFTFYQDSYGRIFASQLFDERIYLTTRSMIDAVTVSGKIIDDQGAPLSVKIENNFFPVYSDFAGGYNLKIPRNWSGNLTPSANQYNFAPARISVNNVHQDLTNQNFVGTYTGTHSVWGFVKYPYGYPVTDVVVTGFDASVKTNEYGAFSVAVPHGWSGEISLALEGWEIAPAMLKIEPVYNNIYAFEFLAKPKGKCIVSGQVKDAEGRPITDAVMEGLPENNRINEEGSYVAVLPKGWSGEIRVTHPHYIFTPASRVIQNLTDDVKDQDFVGTSDQLFRVSGIIRDKKLSALPNVKLLGLPREVKTNESGIFEVQLPAGWSGTITPERNDYRFEPEAITLSNLNADRADLDFSARYVGNYTLSGFVKLADGTGLGEIAINGFSETLKTDDAGFFSASVPAGWSGTITPVSAEFTFAPASIHIVSLDESENQLNFSTTLITQVPDDLMHFEVYPNPSTDRMIQIVSENGGMLRIANSLGQTVWYGHSNEWQGTGFQLPGSGIFFVSITNQKNMRIVKVIAE